MGYIILAASCLAVAVLVFGSWFHRMVGVEIVQTLQIVYYLHFTVNDYSEGERKYQRISVLTLSNGFKYLSSMNTLLKTDYQILSFSNKDA